jgi:hypothetical protein
MENQHPITPPPELVQQWVKRYGDGAGIQPLFYSIFQAGADQELEACCEWLEKNVGRWEIPLELRDARRPNPPSLKEQAQAELKRLIALIPTEGAIAMAEPIRRALEQLRND